jgi:hypothetical protein
MKLKFCTALLTAACILTPLSLVAEKAQNPADAKRAAVENYGKLPLSFEPQGNSTGFLAHSGGYSVSIGARESSVAISDTKSGTSRTLRFAFDGAKAARLEPLEMQQGVTNYYVGEDASKWRLGVKSYARVREQGIYPGVDVVYYGDHRRLEFDFVVAPKADPSSIALSFSGMDKIYKDASGDLVAEVNGQSVRFAKPYAYQRMAGVSKPVAVGYELAAAGKVRLSVGDYDSNSELIIDPVVSYATYLGGSQGDVGNGIVVDGTGAAYVTGETCSSNFPDSPNPSGLKFTPSCDAYVTKYNGATKVALAGTSYIYTTIIGGTTPVAATASGNSIALDGTNEVYITGITNFTNLPGVINYPNGLNSYQGGDSDAFIVILNADGTLKQTSYLGGSGADAGYGIAVDSNLNVIVVGQTCSDDFPRYSAFQAKIEFCVAFVTKLDNALHIGDVLTQDAFGWGASAFTYLPGYFFSEFYAGQLVAPFATTGWAPLQSYVDGAIIVDPLGNVQFTKYGGISGKIEPIAPTPWAGVKYGTTVDGSITWECLGPSVLPVFASTEAYGVALDPLGDIFLAGGTNTANLQPWSYYAGSGAWVLKVSGTTGTMMNGTGGAYVYGSNLEANSTDKSGTVDTARAIAVDPSGKAYVTGTATGTVFTSSGSYSPGIVGQQDAFLVRMNTSGSAIEYATYLGGTGNDQGLGVAADTSGAAYVTGSTQSTNFPVINPLDNPNSSPVKNAPILTLQGQQNAFISKFTADGSALVFSTYLGGSGSDQGNAIALDTGNAGNMYVAGTTSSQDFEQVDPSTYAAPQKLYGGGDNDAFVAMVAGSSLPTVTITPGSLSFGPEDVAMSTGAVAIQYINSNASSSVSILSVTFGGANPSDFMQVFPGTAPGDCAVGVLAPNTACNFWVVFTPSVGGGRSATLTIWDDAGSTPHVITLAGTGETPLVSFNPAAITFASQGIGTPSTAQTVTLKNTGQGTLDIGNIGLTGTNPGDFSLQSDTCSAQLASGSTCTVNLVFTPVSSGTRNADLTVTDNVFGSPSQSITLQGVGAQVLAPSANPTTLTFTPSQPLNVMSAPLLVTIRNNDPASSLSLSAPVITGDFQVAPQAGGGCGSSVPKSSSCVIGVTFTPTASGTRTGTLTIVNDSSSTPLTVLLTGTGGGASVKLSQPAITFASYNLGATSPAQQVTLTNLSTYAVSISGVTVSGPSAAEFIPVNNCGTSIPGLGSCYISVTFQPSADGPQTATLNVANNSVTPVINIALSGTGTAPIMSLTALAPFGNQPLNAPIASLPVTLTNTGTGPLNISGMTISGLAAGDFTETNTCGTQVATVQSGGKGCTITVIFTPTALYSRSATLYINDDAVPSPQTIALLGSGASVKPPTMAPATLTFPGNQALNVASSALQVKVTNTDANYPLSLSQAFATGDFQVVALPAPAANCGLLLAKSGSCVIGVTFTPTASGARSGTLTVGNNATSTPLTTQLTGTGGASASVSPTSLNFNNVNVGQSSLSQTVTLTNPGTFAVNITGVTMSGASATQFVATNNCGTIVKAASNCTINVVFNPTATGTQTAAMTIASDAAVPFTAVTLQGTGTTPGGGGGGSGTIQLSPTSLGFGTASSVQTVTLTNTSSTNALTGLVVSIGGASDFSDPPTPTTCTGSLAAGASCTISVAFNPTTTEAENATLTVAASGATSKTVSLTGNTVFTLTPGATGVSVTQGGTATYSVTVAPVNGFKDSINFTCVGPAGSSCSVNPTSLPMDGIKTPTVTLSVNTTGGNGTSARLAPSQSGSRTIFLALLPFSMMGMLLVNKRRGFWLVLILLGLCLVLGMAGCGSNSSSISPSSPLAPGSYQVVLTAATSGGPSQSVTLGLTVVNQ